MFRDPENALSPNWLHIPIGYNGRASTVVVSGTDIRRPLGQLKGPDDAAPRLGPCARLDIELELGAIVGTPNRMGEPITTAQAYEMIFGYVLLNDWSARDIQVWEYQPLGPFQSKAFATSISPWVVTRDALAPFRVPTPERIKPLLPYLAEDAPYNFDIDLEVSLSPKGGRPTVLSRTNQRYMYYSAAQQLTHHALSGCAMETGDLLGSGTISGPTPDALGSLLEMTQGGRVPVAVDGGTRTFLEDGDAVSLRGQFRGLRNRRAERAPAAPSRPGDIGVQGRLGAVVVQFAQPMLEDAREFRGIAQIAVEPGLFEPGHGPCGGSLCRGLQDVPLGIVRFDHRAIVATPRAHARP